MRPVPSPPIGTLGTRGLRRPGRLLHRGQAEETPQRRRRDRVARWQRPPSPPRRPTGPRASLGRRPRRFLQRQRPPPILGPLDHGPRQPLLRQGDRQSPVGALLRPWLGRSDRRPPRDQSGRQRTAAVGAGNPSARDRLRSQGLHPHAAQFACLSRER